MNVARSSRVLLVDDDDLIVGSLRDYLIRAGCTVEVAINAAAAEPLLHGGSFDAVVVDPCFTGGLQRHSGDVVRRVRALQPATSLIVLTGYTTPALAAAAAACRISALLTKPQSVVSIGTLVLHAAGSRRGEGPEPLQ